MFVIKMFFIPIIAAAFTLFYFDNIPEFSGEKDSGECEQNSESNDVRDNFSIYAGTVADMSWLEVKKHAKEKTLLNIPAAEIEQYASYLCRGMDTFPNYQRYLTLKENFRLSRKGTGRPLVYAADPAGDRKSDVQKIEPEKSDYYAAGSFKKR